MFFGPASLNLAGRRSCQTLRCSTTWSSTLTIWTSSGRAMPLTLLPSASTGGLVPRAGVGSWLLGQTEHPLADDVALDLRGAGVDRARAGAEERAHRGRRRQLATVERRDRRPFGVAGG